MNELNNTALATGTYNSIPTQLTSNTSIVNVIEGLSLTKTANQKNWSSGDLTYTIELDNQAEETYESPVITDVIDTNLVEFLEGSVIINDTVATESQYNYDKATHTLKITLENIAPSSKTTITFRVKKKI